MQIDVNYKIKDKKGKPRRERVPQLTEDMNQKTDSFGNPLYEDGVWFTLKGILEEVCISPPPKINSQTGRPEEIPIEHKKKLFKILHRLQTSVNSIDLSSDEVTLLKTYINRRYISPLLVGQVFNIIDPHDEDWSLEKKEGKNKKKNKTRQSSSGKAH